VDAGLVYAADLAGRVYCLDALSGALQWQHETEDEIWGNPLIADGKLYISARRSFWVFTAGKEMQLLFTSRGGSECGPIAANGVVYAFIRGKLYAIAEGT
jgi:outer membrane protein assembly factor BamB